MKKVLLLILLSRSFTFYATAQKWVANASAGKEYLRQSDKGKTTIPNGRYLTPTGKQVTVTPHPYGLAISADGNIAVTANSGINPFLISVLENILSGSPTVKQIWKMIRICGRIKGPEPII